MKYYKVDYCKYKRIFIVFYLFSLSEEPEDKQLCNAVHTLKNNNKTPRQNKESMPYWPLPYITMIKVIKEKEKNPSTPIINPDTYLKIEKKVFIYVPNIPDINE